MKGLSPKFPLQLDNYLGAYANNLKLADVIKQNFKNLLLTGPGERLMDINFGVGLRRYFFEPMTATVYSDISERIGDQVDKYMPFIVINDVLFDNNNVDDNLLSITISYSIGSLQEVDVLMIQKDSLA
jgi:phage baseplate assembly protein W